MGKNKIYAINKVYALLNKIDIGTHNIRETLKTLEPTMTTGELTEMLCRIHSMMEQQLLVYRTLISEKEETNGTRK